MSESLLFVILGGIAIYLIIRMLYRIFSPRPPDDVIKKLVEVEETTRKGDGDGDSDISRLDDLMIEAESRQPGSTLGLYIQQPHNKFLMGVGSFICSFIIVGWITEEYSFGLLIIPGFIIGVFFLTAPLFQWLISRPRKSR